jgi:excisionase family DNA binding protein
VSESTKQDRPGTIGETSVTSDVWTTDDVAAYLKISANMVRELAKKNQLPGAFQIGSLWRYNAQRIKEFASGTAAAA